MTNIHSSRKIELARRDNIIFMWLIGMTIVDHSTINRFRNNNIC
ncbi:MAG: transposase [Flavobacteriales bacterium]|nr:transposase [Flavobacteriales bacterium]NCQ15164.1 transposase [Flavobacteriales bacterium]NCQ58938.1 transposase [Flavobacteriales bacterium]NCT16324.1 transposase [Flavobacteriales bacterium]